MQTWLLSVGRNAVVRWKYWQLYVSSLSRSFGADDRLWNRLISSVTVTMYSSATDRSTKALKIITFHKHTDTQIYANFLTVLNLESEPRSSNNTYKSCGIAWRIRNFAVGYEFNYCNAIKFVLQERRTRERSILFWDFKLKNDFPFNLSVKRGS